MAEATCAGCGCLCDDIEVTAEGGPVRTCPLGDAWFAEAGDRPPVARVDGREVSVEEAADAAAAILREARAPLVYGLGGTSCEAQRRAVALAEAAGAVIDVGAVASTGDRLEHRDASARSATGPSSWCSGAPTRSSPIHACWSGCASTPAR